MTPGTVWPGLRVATFYELTDILGEIAYGDKPDVIVEGGRKVGIEITNFYLDMGNLTESEQVQSKRRKAVLSEA